MSRIYRIQAQVPDRTENPSCVDVEATDPFHALVIAAEHYRFNGIAGAETIQFCVELLCDESKVIRPERLA